MTRISAAGRKATGGLAAYPTPPHAGATGAAVPASAAGLRIGGVTPLTTIDFPGELAAVVFCHGCPWRCPYCHNPELVGGHRTDGPSWLEVQDFLAHRRGLLDAVVFSGGEPTAQSALEPALEWVKSMGYKTGLHTAGCYPRRLARVLPLLDWVGLDIKAGAADYAALTGVDGSGERAWESLDLLLASDTPFEVRTTVLPGSDAPQRLARLMRDLAAAGVAEYALQACRTRRTLDPGLQGANLPAGLPKGLETLGNALFQRFLIREP